MSYIQEIKKLVQEGRENETADVIMEGMEDIGREVVELVNRHSGDWPIVIAVMRETAKHMENSLTPGGKMLLMLINEEYSANMEVTTTEVDTDELKRQMEEGKQ